MFSGVTKPMFRLKKKHWSLIAALHQDSIILRRRIFADCRVFMSHHVPKFQRRRCKLPHPSGCAGKNYLRDFYKMVCYRIKLDRWPRHVTPSDKRPFFDEITLFATYILGQKVDPIRNVTASQSAFLLFLNSFLTLFLFLNSFWSRFGPKS